jgi:hypothetical protein
VRKTRKAKRKEVMIVDDQPQTTLEQLAENELQKKF